LYTSASLVLDCCLNRLHVLVHQNPYQFLIVETSQSYSFQYLPWLSQSSTPKHFQCMPFAGKLRKKVKLGTYIHALFNNTSLVKNSGGSDLSHSTRGFFRPRLPPAAFVADVAVTISKMAVEGVKFKKREAMCCAVLSSRAGLLFLH
jgi:hypothetical protein